MNLRKNIKRILRREISEAYYKPTEKIDNLINDWLNELFSGSKMYHEETWKSRHDFEWCNKGLEIAHLILFFHTDESVYEDKRPTSERDFQEGQLMIPKSIIDDLTLYVPIRRNYLKYKIEEWFDDNMFSSVTENMGRTDIQIDEIIENQNKTKVCVPPIKKPENVTEDDMVQHILKTTLFKIDDILKHEEKEPGWIEKTYLSKLRNEKIKELRN